MSDDTGAAQEPDPRFPSGPWAGYFLQAARPGRHRMELHLTWRAGVVTGEGRDFVGEFTVRGTYDTATGRCGWVKRYLGRHAVGYEGASDGTGIRGLWEIRYQFEGAVYVDRGVFHIWPVGVGGAEPSALAERANPPAEFEEVPMTPAV